MFSFTKFYRSLDQLLKTLPSGRLPEEKLNISVALQVNRRISLSVVEAC